MMSEDQEGNAREQPMRAREEGAVEMGFLLLPSVFRSPKSSEVFRSSTSLHIYLVDAARTIC